MEWPRKFYAIDSDSDAFGLSAATIMPEDRYWKILAKSQKASTDQQSHYQALVTELGKLTIPEVAGFELRTEQLMLASYNSKLWCAANSMMGFCSDDSFDYFRYWLISRGQNVYYKAINNPDSLVSQMKPNPTAWDYRFEEFASVPYKVLEAKTGIPIYKIPDFSPRPKYPTLHLEWNKDARKAMKICPDIWARLVKNDMDRMLATSIHKRKPAPAKKNTKKKK